MAAMDDPDLLTIGRFARLTGLSVGALRHYDELDLLRPARTDPFTSYRLVSARPARGGADDRPAARPRGAARDDPRLPRARTTRPSAAGSCSSTAAGSRRGRSGSSASCTSSASSAGGTDRHDRTPRRPRPRHRPTLDPATRRKLAADLFNHTWTLLEKPDRTAGRGRRDDPQRPRLALSLGRGRGRRAGQPRPRRVAVLARLRRARARGTGAVARPPLRRDQRGRRPRRLGHRVGIRGDGARLPDGRRPCRDGRLEGQGDGRPRRHRRQDDRDLIEGDLATLP